MRRRAHEWVQKGWNQGTTPGDYHQAGPALIEHGTTRGSASPGYALPPLPAASYSRTGRSFEEIQDVQHRRKRL